MFNELLLDASVLCATLGVGAVLITWLVFQRLQNGLKLGLDFWLAAGLLRLSADPGWNVIGVAAAIVLVRKLAGWGMTRPIRISTDSNQ